MVITDKFKKRYKATNVMENTVLHCKTSTVILRRNHNAFCNVVILLIITSSLNRSVMLSCSATCRCIEIKAHVFKMQSAVHIYSLNCNHYFFLSLC